jgi:hypothetical protein
MMNEVVGAIDGGECTAADRKYAEPLIELCPCLSTTYSPEEIVTIRKALEDRLVEAVVCTDPAEYVIDRPPARTAKELRQRLRDVIDQSVCRPNQIAASLIDLVRDHYGDVRKADKKRVVQVIR